MTDNIHTAHVGEIAHPRVQPGSIVVGHDGSAHSNLALAEALDLAARLGTGVAVVRAWNIDHAPSGSLWKDGYVSSYGEISETVSDQLKEQLQPFALLQPAVEVAYLGAFGHPADVLISAAEEARMLVIGSRGLGGFAGLVLGSVSTQCVHRAVCPVLVVPERLNATALSALHPVVADDHS
ncbi:MAG: universal stress protein [Salinibacterium sp.]|nr:universal stress protein [Salinibacterium sp.]